MRMFKENEMNFGKSNYDDANSNNIDRQSTSSDDCSGDNKTAYDRRLRARRNGCVNDYEDSMSMNGDNSKDLVIESSDQVGGGGNATNADGDARPGHSKRTLKEKHFDSAVADSDNSDAHTVYKTSGDSMNRNKFDFIRARNFDEMQNGSATADHGGLVYQTGGANGTNEPNNGRAGDDATGHVNYASSDDLNQTNAASDHDDKMCSGSEDEGGGE